MLVSLKKYFLLHTIHPLLFFPTQNILTHNTPRSPAEAVHRMGLQPTQGSDMPLTAVPRPDYPGISRKGTSQEGCWNEPGMGLGTLKQGREAKRLLWIERENSTAYLGEREHGDLPV